MLIFSYFVWNNQSRTRLDSAWLGLEMNDELHDRWWGVWIWYHKSDQPSQMKQKNPNYFPKVCLCWRKHRSKSTPNVNERGTILLIVSLPQKVAVWSRVLFLLVETGCSRLSAYFDLIIIDVTQQHWDVTRATVHEILTLMHLLVHYSMQLWENGVCAVT